MIVRRIFRNLGLLVSGKAGAGLISLLYLIIAARALVPRDCATRGSDGAHGLAEATS